MLRIENLQKSYGGVHACDDVSLTFEEGTTTALVGPNGAGKSTMIQLMSGVVSPDSGKMWLADLDLTGKSSEQRSALGISRTFQTARVFPGLSVRESIMVGAYNGLLYRHEGLTALKTTADIISSVMNLPSWRRRQDEARHICDEVMALFGERLLPRQDDFAFSLSYANRRRVEIARVIASRPRVLLLDEPTAGMNPTETIELGEVVRNLRVQHPEMTLVFVEHKMNVVRSHSSRVIVMDAGKVIADGTPDVALAQENVIHAYMGYSDKGN